MSDLFLFHTPGACSRVTINALEEAGFEYGERAINIFKGEQKSSEYQKVNPNGKVPALKVGDNVLTENPAILMYLHMLKPEAGLLPVTDTPFDQAKIYSDLAWFSGTVHPIVRRVRMSFLYTDGDPSGVYAKGAEEMHTLLANVDARLENSLWWYGDDWTILDVYLYWCYTTAASAEFSIDAYPQILAHADRVRARPSYQRALGRELAAMQKSGIELPGGAKLK